MVKSNRHCSTKITAGFFCNALATALSRFGIEDHLNPKSEKRTFFFFFRNVSSLLTHFQLIHMTSEKGLISCTLQIRKIYQRPGKSKRESLLTQRHLLYWRSNSVFIFIQLFTYCSPSCFKLELKMKRTVYQSKEKRKHFPWRSKVSLHDCHFAELQGRNY